MRTTIDQDELKDLIKTAVAEGLEENRGLLGEIIEVALEEIALVRAIEEGLATHPVPREEVFPV